MSILTRQIAKVINHRQIIYCSKVYHILKRKAQNVLLEVTHWAPSLNIKLLEKFEIKAFRSMTLFKLNYIRENGTTQTLEHNLHRVHIIRNFQLPGHAQWSLSS